MEPEDQKKKKKEKKSDVEINPDVETDARNIRVESLSEALSRMGRIRLARAMKRSNKSGKLSRGKKRKEARAMTMNRAKGLGWRGARRDLKKKLSGGQNMSSAAQRARVEKLANKRRTLQKAMAKKKTRQILNQSFEINDLNLAFSYMCEGKRYHQLLNGKGQVKFDMRFKQFKNAPKPEMKEEHIMQAVSEMMDVMTTQDASGIDVMLNASLIALNKLVESDSSKSVNHHALTVSKTFGVDVQTIMGKYNG